MMANIFPHGEHDMEMLSFPKNLEDTLSCRVYFM